MSEPTPPGLDPEPQALDAEPQALDAEPPVAGPSGVAGLAHAAANPPDRGSRRLLLAATGVVTITALVISMAILVPGSGAPRAAAWSWSPVPKPSDWRYYGWGNPALEIALPADWSGGEIYLRSVDPSQPADERARQEQMNDWLRDGAWRVSINSPMSSASPATGDWTGILVDAGEGSLTAFADRHIATSGHQPATRSDIRLPAGQAIALTFLSQAAPSSSGQSFDWVEVDYLVALPDGRHLAILVTRWSERGGGLPDRSAVEALALQIAQTLRVTP